MRGADDRARHPRQQRRVPQQRRTPVLADNLVHRTAEIEIEKVWTHPVNHGPRSLCQPFRLGSEQLNADGTLVFLKFQVVLRPRVPVKDAFRRDELGRQNVRALRLADLAKDSVRHAGHRRKKQWEIRGHSP